MTTIPLLYNESDIPIIDLGYSKIKGYLTSESNIFVWKGIPFAQKPIGNLRWKPPKSLIDNNKDDIIDAIHYGKSSVQGGGAKGGDEDCLYMNIWSPLMNKDKLLPVMVFIHGGGFQMGSSTWYDGSHIVNTSISHNQPVLFVSFNYRLGLFGFFFCSQLRSESSTQNFGLHDQEFALEWIKFHISKFGGDPNDLTLIGQSAGSASICLHLLNQRYEEKSLISKVIIASCGYPCYHDMLSPSQQKSFVELLANRLNLDPNSDNFLDQLREKSTEELIMASGDLEWLPSVDGIIIQNIPALISLETHSLQLKGCMIGSVSHEGHLFCDNITEPLDLFQGSKAVFKRLNEEHIQNIMRLYENDKSISGWDKAMEIAGDLVFKVPTVNMTRFIENGGEIPIYKYHFSEPSVVDCDGNKRIVPHSSELTYFFKWPSSFPFGKSDHEKLATSLQLAWITFATSGNPILDDIEWPQFHSSDKNIVCFHNSKVSLEKESNSLSEEKLIYWTTLDQELVLS